MFRVFATLDQRTPLSRVPEQARRAESLGFDGLCVPEAVHDGLLAAAAALSATDRLRVATGVLVAFPRSPMVVAHAAWDLQEASGGRFELGLGSQVRGNITGRFSTPWSPPVPRMREYVGALRAIFASFHQGAPLAFQGEHYRFSRLQPFFNPGPIAHPEIPIAVAAVGPGMLGLAGEVADGLFTHPTNTAPRYLREVVRPALARGAARSGRDPGAARLTVSPLCATGPDATAVAQAREQQRALLAFLFSTPAYWRSLDLFGWGERGRELNRRVRQGRFGELSDLVSDEMLTALVPSAPYAELAGVLMDWYGGLADRVALPLPGDASADADLAAAVARLRG